MPPSAPRRAWHSSMIAPMYSLGAMIIALTTGSYTSAIFPPGQSLGLVTTCSAPSSISDAVDHVRRGGDEVEAELALQPLPDDLQVQQAEEADPVAEAERAGGLRLVDQRGVVEPQLVQRVAQQRVVRAVHRIEAGVDHRLRVAVAASAAAAGFAASVTVSPTRDCRTSFTPVIR